MPLRKSQTSPLLALLALCALALAPGVATAAPTATVGISAPVVETIEATETTVDAVEEPTPASGGLLAAGDNGAGELGLGTVGDERNFWQAGRDLDWTAVAGGADFSCALRAEGSLWCFGGNGLGQLGQGDTTRRPEPTQVGTSTRWTQVAAGQYHACGVQQDGTLWCWGSGSLGKLGQGNSTTQRTPVQVPGSGWAAASLGVDSTCALKTDGTLWCWGYGGSGQLGNGSVSSQNTPVQVGSSSAWTQVSSGGYHACGTQQDGTLWCWGDNNLGEAGSGNTTKQRVPARVGRDHDWASVTGAFDSTCALKTDGTLWCWGYGGSGQLGNGSVSSRKAPTQVGTDGDWTSVVASKYSTCGRKADTTMWCWGYNAQGQLGLGDRTQRRVPEQVQTPVTVSVIGGGPLSDHRLVVSEDTTPVNACPETPTTKIFSSIGDFADYSLAPGGDFEGAGEGWTLKNAALVPGNEDLGFLGGTRSLALGGHGSGGTTEAVSPEFCINATHPTFRYLVRNSSSASGIVYTALRFRPKNNPAVVLEVGSRADIGPRGGWRVADPTPLATLIATTLLKQGGTVQLVFRTSSATNSGGGVQLDNILVDPYRRG